MQPPALDGGFGSGTASTGVPASRPVYPRQPPTSRTAPLGRGGPIPDIGGAAKLSLFDRLVGRYFRIAHPVRW
jgi:hypothetical protein